MARRPRPDGAALQRVVAHVQTHNRVLQEDEMWERHRAAAAGPAAAPPAGQRTTNTPESIAEARREAELRRTAVKEAAASAAGRAELQSTATDLQPEPAKAAARERAERKAERKAKKAEKKAKKAERRAIKKERKDRKRRRKASGSDSSSSNS